MRKREFISGALGIGLLLGNSCAEKNKSAAESGRPKPNIIIILADDLGYGDVSFLGQQKFSTPNIDRLASGGMVFTDHYSGCTVSAPSRSALMTGLHTGHTYIRGNKEHKPEGQEPLLAQCVTVAELLQSAGYTTGAFGKWGLGFPGSEGDPLNQGFDEFFGYKCQTLAHNYYPRYLWHNSDTVFLRGNDRHGTAQYAPDTIHAEALKFLEKNKDHPFFMFYPTTIPHAELLVPERELSPFRGKFLPEKAFSGTDDGERYRKGPYGSQAECHAAYAAMVSLLDKKVGEIMDKIKSLGIENNTILFFSSDNGPHLEGGADPDYFNSNGPFRGYKRDLYEGGIRVPLVVYWPGMVKPGKTAHISAFWDFLPTCCDLAGLNTPSGSDGISYLPVMLGKTKRQKKHDYLYWEFHEGGMSQAIRAGNWKAVKKNADKEMELYDLNSDPGETQNIAGTNVDIVNQMKIRLENCRTESAIWPSSEK